MKSLLSVVMLSSLRAIRRAQLGLFCFLCLWPLVAQAAVDLPFTIALSEAVAVTGSPRIAVDVGGVTRYATYASGSGTASLTFTYTAQAGDVDLDGVTVSSPIDLNGGTIKDLAGNALSSLAFTPPVTTGVKINYPSLSMDFASSDYILSGTHYATLPSFLTAASGTFTRASIGTYFDNTGTLQTASADMPRLDYDPVTHVAKGLLTEEARTNTIRNSTMLGGAIGVFPVNWSCAPYDGLVCTVTGTGTEAGMPYLDIRINGTAASSLTNTNITLFFEVTSQIAAASGQIWTLSLPVTYQSGTGHTLLMQMEERTAGGGLLASSATAFAVPSSGSLAAHRLTLTRTLSNASTARVSGSLRLFYAANEVVDMTFRVGIPQLEQGAFVTSYIPTTNAAVTRAADSFIVPLSAGWFNASEGSVFAQASARTGTAALSPGALVSFDDNSINNRIQFRRASPVTYPNFRLVVAGASLADAGAGGTWNNTLTHKISGGYKSAANSLYFDGSYQTGYTAPSSMPTLTQMQIGYGPGSLSFNGAVEVFRYYPVLVDATQLQLLSQ